MIEDVAAPDRGQPGGGCAADADSDRGAAVRPLPGRRGPRCRGAGHRRDAAPDRGRRRRARRPDVLAAPGERPGARVPLPRGDHRQPGRRGRHPGLPAGRPGRGPPGPPDAATAATADHHVRLHRRGQLRGVPRRARTAAAAPRRRPGGAPAGLRGVAPVVRPLQPVQPVGRRAHLDHARSALAGRSSMPASWRSARTSGATTRSTSCAARRSCETSTPEAR